jgi:hypothetical protein
MYNRVLFFIGIIHRATVDACKMSADSMEALLTIIKNFPEGEGKHDHNAFILM